MSHELTQRPLPQGRRHAVLMTSAGFAIWLTDRARWFVVPTQAELPPGELVSWRYEQRGRRRRVGR